MDNLFYYLFRLQHFAATTTIKCADGIQGNVNVPTSDPTNCVSYETGLPTSAANESTLRIALQIGFGVIGAVAVIYILYAAFRFVRSQGDPQQVTQARNTILYAIIGLAIALLAEIIVTYTLGRI